MSKHAASESVLGELHKKVAQRLIKEVDREEFDEDGNEKPVSVGILTASIAFLKANEITCNEDTQAVNELEAKLVAKRRKRVGNVVQLHEEDE